MTTETLLKNIMNVNFNTAMEYGEKFRLYWMEKAIERNREKVSLFKAFVRKKRKEREDKEFNEFFFDLCGVVQEQKELKK